MPTPERIAALYPRLYSEKRFDEWQALFEPRALVVRVEAGSVTSQTIEEAMGEQKEYAAESHRFDEQWRDVEIRRHGGIAVIRAGYTLTTDREIRRGTDVLTLVEGEDGWRIALLAYEQTDMAST